MDFTDIMSSKFIYLYAGDVPNLPQYRSKNMVGLSLTQSDSVHIKFDVTKKLPLPDNCVDIYQ